ncbi:hypothetical protein BS47DRAFT_129062 [Hydnum rufescens UP504]|uniref:L-arabinokinase n=1 Tax=Hydnum rufescens UP504 TaxID=1448309 RepID=A0A9P6AQW0_9AGAM|nr:hypothetical protein BS47DRAFT_129062 [Hydnum rufescens UP504]
MEKSERNTTGASTSCAEQRMRDPLRLAYYCSGHGFGHATRVTAISCHLLTLSKQSSTPSPPIEIIVVSTAPSVVFSECLALGALYRYAEVDPVISQPVAYSVDRKRSLEVLRDFIKHREEKLAEEALWMRSERIDCVLSDAVFLACAAANEAGLPSVLITNFTFDSNWSWLASDIPKDTPWATKNHSPNSTLVPGIPDDSSAYEPLREHDLEPLVSQMRRDYQCADLLYLLPGAIPIPSFSVEPALPATGWVSHSTKSFHPGIVDMLKRYRGSASSIPLHPLVPFPFSTSCTSRQRAIYPAPLIVRHPSPDIFTASGRSRFLESIGVPPHLHGEGVTRILIVSFGGQKFRRPGSANASPSIQSSPELAPETNEVQPHNDIPPLPIGVLEGRIRPHVPHLRASSMSQSLRLWPPGTNDPVLKRRQRHASAPSRMIVTPTQLFIPGAPGPVANPSSPIKHRFPSSIIPTIHEELAESPVAENGGQANAIIPQLLPSSQTWIAVVCGAGDDWGQESDLPEGLYVAPRDIYMPDLMVIGDVLLGKLGYGTVAEAIDSGTPFVYVPRPAIIEELGLKLLLEEQGVGVEFSREKYEDGDWGSAVEEAWTKGAEMKERRRREGNQGVESESKRGKRWRSLW